MRRRVLDHDMPAWDNNRLELKEFLEKLSVDEFFSWICKCYGVKKEEQKEIEKDYEPPKECDEK